ncbi:PPR domain-containing protein/PPR_2 domain-containing protein, partial [Cephalotus follicularis]
PKLLTYATKGSQIQPHPKTGNPNPCPNHKKPQTPLLKSLAHNSSTPQNVLILYNEMLCHPSCINHYTFTHALKACSLSHAHQKGLQIHAHIINSGHLFDTFIQNSLLHFYLVENDIFTARQIFDSIVIPDVVSWTTIISGFSRCGFEKEAINMFSLMDVKPNFSTLVSVISACSSLRAIHFGKAIHAYSFRNLNDNNIIWDNAVLDFYVKCGSLVSAKYLFVEMPNRDVVSWTTMVGGYAQRGLREEAVGIFEEMVESGEAVPNEATVVNVLAACSSIGALSLGRYLHTYIIRTRPDLLMNDHVGNALINMYFKCGNVALAIKVFDMLTGKDIISWSTLISGLAMNGHGKQVLQLFSPMIVNGVSPDDVTFIGLLSACSHAGLVDEGMMFFKAMRNVYGILPQMQHYACMVDMCGRAGLLEDAEAFIRETPMKAEGQVWGALLNACKVHGNDKIFERIRQGLVNSEGVSTGTFALLSNIFAGTDRWADADEVRDEMICLGLKKTAGCSWIEV